MYSYVWERCVCMWTRSAAVVCESCEFALVCVYVCEDVRVKMRVKSRVQGGEDS